MSRYACLSLNWVNPNKLPEIAQSVKHSSKYFEFRFGAELRRLEDSLDKRDYEGRYTKPSFLRASMLPRFKNAKSSKKPLKQLGKRRNFLKQTTSLHSSAVSFGFEPSEHKGQKIRHDIQRSSLSLSKAFSIPTKQRTLRKLDLVDFQPVSCLMNQIRRSSSTQTEAPDQLTNC